MQWHISTHGGTYWYILSLLQSFLMWHVLKFFIWQPCASPFRMTCIQLMTCIFVVNRSPRKAYFIVGNNQKSHRVRSGLQRGAPWSGSRVFPDISARFVLYVGRHCRGAEPTGQQAPAISRRCVHNFTSIAVHICSHILACFIGQENRFYISPHAQSFPEGVSQHAVR